MAGEEIVNHLRLLFGEAGEVLALDKFSKETNFRSEGHDYPLFLTESVYELLHKFLISHIAILY